MREAFGVRGSCQARKTNQLKTMKWSILKPEKLEIEKVKPKKKLKGFCFQKGTQKKSWKVSSKHNISSKSHIQMTKTEGI